jgi:hypothetical protein
MTGGPAPRRKGNGIAPVLVRFPQTHTESCASQRSARSAIVWTTWGHGLRSARWPRRGEAMSEAAPRIAAHRRLRSGRAGDMVGVLARDTAVAVSLCLQFGCDVETLRRALMRDSQGRASSAVGALLDLLASGRGS